MNEEIARKLLIALIPMFPYGVKIDREWIAPMTGSPEHHVVEFSTFDVGILQSWLDDEGAGLTKCVDGVLHWVRGYSCKPYLRPLSSMTEEEKKELEALGWRVDELDYNSPWAHNSSIDSIIDGIEWLHMHFFDYRGLIEKGLALPAPEGMYT